MKTTLPIYIASKYKVNYEKKKPVIKKNMFCLIQINGNFIIHQKNKLNTILT